LLVLNIGLPVVDGLTILREIRANGQRIPVFILTARDSLEDTVAGLDTGADDYVTKPFRFEEILARVRARLRSEPLQTTRWSPSATPLLIFERAEHLSGDGWSN
jgi:two-component system, OmpR family, copper resistance phosphate regulon response regulator CusR